MLGHWRHLLAPLGQWFRAECGCEVVTVNTAHLLTPSSGERREGAFLLPWVTSTLTVSRTTPPTPPGLTRFQRSWSHWMSPPLTPPSPSPAIANPSPNCWFFPHISTSPSLSHHHLLHTCYVPCIVLSALFVLTHLFLTWTLREVRQRPRSRTLSRCGARANARQADSRFCFLDGDAYCPLTTTLCHSSQVVCWCPSVPSNLSPGRSQTPCQNINLNHCLQYSSVFISGWRQKPLPPWLPLSSWHLLCHLPSLSPLSHTGPPLPKSFPPTLSPVLLLRPFHTSLSPHLVKAPSPLRSQASPAREDEHPPETSPGYAPVLSPSEQCSSQCPRDYSTFPSFAQFKLFSNFPWNFLLTLWLFTICWFMSKYLRIFLVICYWFLIQLHVIKDHMVHDFHLFNLGYLSCWMFHIYWGDWVFYHLGVKSCTNVN